jgi:serine/threonine-protein kinase RsbW
VEQFLIEMCHQAAAKQSRVPDCYEVLMNPTLRIDANLSIVSTVRQFVEEACASLQVPAWVTGPLVLAVDEVVTNIIQHGYRGGPGEIEIEIERAPDAVVVYVGDQAPPFDPTRLPDPDINLPLDERPEGGMGVYMARRSVDGMSHRLTDQGGNQVTLTKKTTVRLAGG